MSISLLRRLLMKEAVKDTAGSSGIMSINKNITDKVEKQLQKYVSDAMQQGVDLDTLSPEQLKMIVQMNKPKPPRVIPADSPEGRGITQALFGKRGEVVDFPQKRSFKQEVDDMIKDGTITKGARGMKKSKKVTDREMFQAANKRLKTEAQLKKEIESNNKKGVAGIKKRQLTEDEYQDFLDEIGGADQLEAYNFDGTVGDAKRIIKEQKDYMSQMKMEFRKGRLDPEPGSRTPERKRFLQKKLEEAESSGDARLLSREEREELFDLDDIPEYSSGGVAGLLGERPKYQTGGDVAFDASDASVYGSNAITVTPETVADAFGNQVQQEMGNTYNPPLIEEVQEEKAAVEDTKKEEVMQRPGPDTSDLPIMAKIPDFLKDADGNPLLSSKPIRSPMPVLGNPELAGPVSSISTLKAKLEQANDLQGEPLVDQIKSRMQQQDVKPDHWNKYAQDVMDTNGYPSKTLAQYAEEAGVKTNQTGILKSAPITNLPGLGIENTNSMGNETGMPVAGGGEGSDSIMQGFQESDIFKNMMGRPSTADFQTYTLDGKEMSGSGTYFGGLRKYLESIGKGDLLQRNNSGLQTGLLQTSQPGEGGKFGIYGQSPLAQSAMANGGRAGFMAGGMGRRGFLKLLAGAGAGIA